MGTVKAPYFNTVFSMALPDGVTVKSFASSPKVATTPMVDGGVVTWTLGSVKPGGKVKVTLKLSATACTTPDTLALNGQFEFNDTLGPQMVRPCLKKPLYVWANSCEAIPKPAKLGKHGNSTGTKPGESWNQCDCNACKVSGFWWDCWRLFICLGLPCSHD